MAAKRTARRASTPRSAQVWGRLVTAPAPLVYHGDGKIDFMIAPVGALATTSYTRPFRVLLGCVGDARRRGGIGDVPHGIRRCFDPDQSRSSQADGALQISQVASVERGARRSGASSPDALACAVRVHGRSADQKLEVVIVLAWSKWLRSSTSSTLYSIRRISSRSSSTATEAWRRHGLCNPSSGSQALADGFGEAAFVLVRFQLLLGGGQLVELLDDDLGRGKHFF